MKKNDCCVWEIINWEYSPKKVFISCQKSKGYFKYIDFKFCPYCGKKVTVFRNYKELCSELMLEFFVVTENLVFDINDRNMFNSINVIFKNLAEKIDKDLDCCKIKLQLLDNILCARHQLTLYFNNEYERKEDTKNNNFKE